MKKYFLRLTAIVALSLVISFESSAQFVIKVRPAAPVMRVRTVAPGPKHVWINGEYVWRGGQYIYTDGYWVVPPRNRTHWVEGRWKHKRGGWVWIPGHWK